MDWDDLRVFLAVARTESLSRAGARLGMNASTVGRRIARLAVRLRTADPREVDAAFLKRVAQDMRDISELLSERYFAPASGHLSAYGGSTVE